MEGVRVLLKSQAVDFFDTGIQKLIPRHKCFSSGGDYVWNYLKYVHIVTCTGVSVKNTNGSRSDD
jgi:hypothetical protein